MENLQLMEILQFELCNLQKFTSAGVPMAFAQALEKAIYQFWMRLVNVVSDNQTFFGDRFQIEWCNNLNRADFNVYFHRNHQSKNISCLHIIWRKVCGISEKSCKFKSSLDIFEKISQFE